MRCISMLEGYTTRDGTKRFKDRFKNDRHFKEVHGLYLTTIGMGTYLGNINDEDDKMIRDAIRLSISNGLINIIDTAINYRAQRSERAIRESINSMINDNIIARDEVFISTKNGYLTHDGELDIDIWEYIQTRLINTGIIDAEDISSSYHCMKISYLEDQLERSRRNLGLDCIDLIYLHNPIESQVYDLGKERFMRSLRDIFEFYEHKRGEGKIRYYGLATWNAFRVKEDHIEYLNLYELVKMAESIKKDHGFRFIQLPFNIVMHEAYTLKNQVIDNEKMSIIDAASRLKIGIFSSVPLMQGNILNKMPEFGGIRSAAVRCLQFARSSRVIPLVGQKKIEHVKDNMGIKDIEPLENINLFHK